MLRPLQRGGRQLAGQALQAQDPSLEARTPGQVEPKPCQPQPRRHPLVQRPDSVGKMMFTSIFGSFTRFTEPESSIQG